MDKELFECLLWCLFLLVGLFWIYVTITILVEERRQRRWWRWQDRNYTHKDVDWTIKKLEQYANKE